MENNGNAVINNTNTSVPYQLFLHIEELRRPRTRIYRLSKTKMDLTTKLIKNTMHKMQDCSMEDLRTLDREISFKEKLRSRILRMQEIIESRKQSQIKAESN